MSETPTISSPIDVQHETHVDQNLNWTFDSSVNPKSIFTKLKLIGKGGFGTVYQIVHRPSMKCLAGKMVHSSLVDVEHSEEIQNEINILKEVNSQFTLRYYGCVNYENSLMILMDFCDKGSIRDILDNRQKVLSEDQISIILKDHLLALRILHGEYRIAHRDIKCANLLMNRHGHIKIGDFGVSRRFDSGSSTAVSIVGTPYWMAPEVISAVKYGFPSDIWSTGIMAVELAEGSPPYVEYPPTKAMIEIASNGFPGYRFPEMHSPDFIDFVSHCLEYNPMKRWSIDQLLDHPFIRHAEFINREESLKELLTGIIEEYTDIMEETTVNTVSSSTSTISSLVVTASRTLPPTDEELSEITWVKNARRNSNKSPFVPFVLATNPDAPIKTLYSYPGMSKVIDEDPRIFNDYGMILFKNAIKDWRAPYIIAALIISLVMLMFGQKGFLIILLMSLGTNMILIYSKQRENAVKEIEEENNEPKIVYAMPQNPGQ